MKPLNACFVGSTPYFLKCSEWFLDCGHNLLALYTDNKEQQNWAKEEDINIFEKEECLASSKIKGFFVVVDQYDLAVKLMKMGHTVLFNKQSEFYSKNKNMPEEWFIKLPESSNTICISYSELHEVDFDGRLMSFANILSKMSRHQKLDSAKKLDQHKLKEYKVSLPHHFTSSISVGNKILNLF